MHHRLKRLRFLSAVSSLALLCYSPTSLARAASQKPQQNTFSPPAALVKQLQGQQAQGWKLTNAGARIVANLSLTIEDGTTGAVLLASTDDPALAESNAGVPTADQDARQASVGSSKQAPSLVRRDTAHCLNPARKMRSLAMTAGTGYICDWGVRAYMLYSAYYGASSIKWTQQNALGQASNTFSHQNCSQVACQWLGFSDPPTGLKIVFGEAYHFTWVRIDSAWCA